MTDPASRLRSARPCSAPSSASMPPPTSRPAGPAAPLYALGPEIVPQRLDDAVEDGSGGVLAGALEQHVGEPAGRLVHLEIHTKRISGEGLIAQDDIAIAVAEDDRRAEANRAS